MTYTRREVGGFTLAALSIGRVFGKPDSNYGGVQIGIIISPTALPGLPLRADEILNNLVQLGISAVEMQDIRVEAYAGAPATPHGGTALTQQQRSKSNQANREWRVSTSMDKYKALRKMYADAGVDIFAFRLGRMTMDTPDDELAYFFNAAQALGARQITMELPKDPALTQRLGDYAATRKLLIGYHNHTQVNFNSWDVALSQSKYNGINFDVGHFAAATSQSPIPFIEKHHDRIASLHLKDRKFGTNGGKNVPWGQGDTPLKEILLTMKQRGYKFPASIELEYPIPEGSSSMAEISKCVRYCRDVLA